MAPNHSPETEITSSDPPEGGRVPHHVEILWRGADVDGTVRDYEYILDSYPRSIASFGEIVPRVPEDEDPRWVPIKVASVALVALADTLRADPRADIGDGRFDRWHTFYVRAIDNQGSKDPTPARRTFNSFTFAPSVWLDSPAQVGDPTILPRSFVMNWDGFDEIPDTNRQDPLEVRWVLLGAQVDVAGQPIGFPDALYDVPEAQWSNWFAWGAADSTGREATLLDVLPRGAVDSTFVFAVQARDEGGAITPQFKNEMPGENNYTVILVQSTRAVGPRFPVRETAAGLGSWTFDENADPVVVVAAGVDTVKMEWGPMVTTHYGANSSAYRFAWNIVDPLDDDEWSPWGTTREAAPHAVVESGEEFRVQARDHIGLVTTAIVLFQTQTTRD